MIHEFRDVKFMSAAQKTTALRTWIRFLKSGLQFEHFTNALYDHLIQHCSFIAHYNRAGFYSHFFDAGDSIVRFLSQFDSRDPCLSVEYGDRLWLCGDDYQDINQARIAEGRPMIPLLIEIAERKQKAADVAAATALLAKHGISTAALQQRDSVAPTAAVLQPTREPLPYS